MNAVIDASIAVKWVVPEDGTEEALALLDAGGLIAPDLIIAECANILWKKTMRGELKREEADIAARLLAQSAIEILPTRSLLAAATNLAVQLSHPAYDCVYLALARECGAPLVTADDRLCRKLAAVKSKTLRSVVLSLKESARLIEAAPRS